MSANSFMCFLFISMAYDMIKYIATVKKIPGGLSDEKW